MMSFIIFLFFIASFTVYSEVFHKMEHMIPRNTFVKSKRSPKENKHEVIFAVKQRNYQLMENIVLERSTPGSPKYRQWLTFDGVGEITSNKEGAEEIISWLKNNKVEITWHSKHLDYIKASTTIAHWEELLNAEFHEWEDQSFSTLRANHKTLHRAEHYSIPSELKDHVHAVFHTVQVPPAYSPKYHVRKEGEPFKDNLRMEARKTQEITGYVTVSFLNDYYKVNSNLANSSLSQSVFETSDQYFSPADLNTFQNTFELTVQAAESIGGHNTTTCETNDDDGNECFEGNLDVQYIMGMSQLTTTIYWYVGGSDPYVDWITDVADSDDPPLSNSMSYGSIEQYESTSVMSSFNTEAQKLASMGVTVMVSSGDDGAPNNDGFCMCTKNSGSAVSSWEGSNTWTGEGYFPSFPATCPYVTAVGATMGPEEGNPEIACQSQQGGVITSGGGFSTYFEQPSWQTDAVDTYFNSLLVQPASGYNRYGRAYPDISYIGVKYQVVVGGLMYSIYGTSCSSPMFAGFVSLVNAARAANGSAPIGFINPTLYNSTYSSLFNDVTEGNNRCCSADVASQAVCCVSGFQTAAGWDPATGWGSMNYTSFSYVFDVFTPYSASDDDSSSNDADISTGWIIMGAVLGGSLVLVAVLYVFFRHFVRKPSLPPPRGPVMVVNAPAGQSPFHTTPVYENSNL